MFITIHVKYSTKKRKNPFFLFIRFERLSAEASLRSQGKLVTVAVYFIFQLIFILPLFQIH